MAFRKLTHEESLGRYRLVAQLGHGGMADVFVARRAGADGAEQLVAVKRMLPSLAADRASVAMFLHEGRVAAQLAHPNICRVLELGEVDGTPFLAMELLFGLPWSEIVPAVPDRPAETLVRFVAGAAVQACEGLHHAHVATGADQRPRSVVHRDVSPSNLFITSEGCVKLLDFGVSKVVTEATVTGGARKGKLPYMAPEQLQGMPVDIRADIFSLGVVTWEALAGRALFDRRSDREIMQAVAHADIPALPGARPVSERLDAVLRRALARDRTQRHGSAHELAGDLRRAIAACGEPMAPSEIAAQLATWLGPSLARRARDLAELGGEVSALDAATGESTVRHEPAPVAGARLRERSVVIGGAATMDGVAPTLPAGGPAGGPAVQPTDAPGPALNLEDAPRDRRHRGAMPSSGELIGKYRLGKKLGEGAFGRVFIARDTGLDRDVALKFLRAHHVSNPQVVERFLQEARSAAKLSHPGIVTVYELGTGRDGTVFIAMELLRGESLNDRLRRMGRLPPDAALEICRQIASVLEAAHQAGIVHRDLKPDNIFLAVDSTMPGGERVKVLDFGIAKLAARQTTAIQTGSLVLGTPRYMSPEQCSSSANVDHRSDIYALGCILYELVCGRALFNGGVGEIIAMHQLIAPPAARDSVPDLSPALDRLISWMLAKDPGERPQTMERVEGEITSGLAGVPTMAAVPVGLRRADTAGPVAVTPAAEPAQNRTTLSGSTNSVAAPASRRRVGVVLTTAAVLAGVVVGVIVTRTPDRSAATPPADPPPGAAPSTLPPPPVATGSPPVAASASPAAEPRAADPVPADAGAASAGGAEPPAPARRLTPDSIVATVRGEYAAELQRCFERHAKPSRGASRKLVVTLHVAATGRVVDYQTDPPMPGCEVLANMRFAADGDVDDPSRRVTAEVAFDYPSLPARTGAGAPARAAHSCPPGTVWKPSESACGGPPDKKPCPPIKDRVIDPFDEDPCRQ
jgi:serine/threonine-protein kinase